MAELDKKSVVLFFCSLIFLVLSLFFDARLWVVVTKVVAFFSFFGVMSFVVSKQGGELPYDQVALRELYGFVAFGFRDHPVEDSKVRLVLYPKISKRLIDCVGRFCLYDLFRVLCLIDPGFDLKRKMVIDELESFLANDARIELCSKGAFGVEYYVIK